MFSIYPIYLMIDIITYFFAALLGLGMGSFLNAWVWRTRSGHSIIKGRSMCTSCKTVLRAIDNIPIISFLYLKGKAFCCRKKISWQYPLVEAAMALLFVGAAYIYKGDAIMTSISFVVLFFFMFVFVYDLRYGEIWDKMTTVPAAILFFVQGQLGILAWQDMAFGALIGGGFFLLQLVVSRGKWIGGGDIRMGLFLGIVLGWQRTIFALLISYVGGAIVGVYLLARKKVKKHSTIPFGTFLAFGGAVALFWGYAMIEWYMRLLHI
jgi:leader peptidase (prepilin peptidase) / N-methyltransferase